MVLQVLERIGSMLLSTLDPLQGGYDPYSTRKILMNPRNAKGQLIGS